jgi:triacylglycerol lipase
MADQDPPPTNDPLNLATLHLCSASYARDLLTIPGLVQATHPLTDGGLWTCLWGPAQSRDEANLAFVAGYSSQPGLAVQSICVTIRGTNIYLGEDIWGILLQVWEDVDAATQVSVSWPGWGDAKIAKGTSDGLTVVMGLTDKTTGESLGHFLKTFLGNASNANVTSLVTGHSLGACLATVVAPWIESIRPASYKGIIQPITFAGPTAGNGDFAACYTKKFKTARRFQNTLDIIPLALEKLPEIAVIYLPDNWRLLAPDLVVTLIIGMLLLLAYNEVTYVQPVQIKSQGKQMLSGAFFQQDKDDWYAQALHQHHPATYRGLLTGKPVDVSALPQPIERRGREARLAKEIGSIDEAVKRLAAVLLPNK